MKLKAKILNIATKGPYIAILNKVTAAKLNIEPLDRIKIRDGSKKELVVAVDFSYGKKEIAENEIGLFLDVSDILGIRDNELVNASIIPKPVSLEFIKKKLDGHELSKDEMDKIIKDIVNNELTEIESTYFVSGCYIHKLSLDEAAYLTEAILNNGGRLNFSGKTVVDKHCIGGIGGNRTTMVITPIIAAAGFYMPKTSTRSITSPAGTSDVMEVLAPVSHSKEKIMDIVKKTNACMVWGGTMDLASADDKLIKLERPLNLDPEGIMLASILAKKASAGASHVIIDIPVGPEAKIKEIKKAKDLAKKFIVLGRRLNMNIKVLLTDGSQPVGNGVGPALEARDVLSVLEGHGPVDLRDKSLYMASMILEMAGVPNSYNKAKNILDSGLALHKMKDIIKAQGGNPKVSSSDIKLGFYTYTFNSGRSGKVSYLSNNLVNKIAKAAGAPFDKGSGLYLHKKLNDKVSVGDPLITIYADNIKKLEYAKSFNLSKVFNFSSREKILIKN